MNEAFQIHQTENGEFVIEGQQFNLKLQQVEFERFVDQLTRFQKFQKAREEFSTDVLG